MRKGGGGREVQGALVFRLHVIHVSQGYIIHNGKTLYNELMLIVSQCVPAEGGSSLLARLIHSAVQCSVVQCSAV